VVVIAVAEVEASAEIVVEASEVVVEDVEIVVASEVTAVEVSEAVVEDVEIVVVVVPSLERRPLSTKIPFRPLVVSHKIPYHSQFEIFQGKKKWFSLCFVLHQ
jgi:hypothetical protein